MKVITYKLFLGIVSKAVGLDIWVEKYTIWPKVLTVVEGKGIFIYCNTFSTPTWTHNGNRVFVGVASKSVLITRARVEHSGLYTCDGLNMKKILISVSSRVFVTPKHKGGIYPEVSTVNLGMDATFKCNSNSKVTWNFIGSSSLPSNVSPINDNTLNIYKTTDQGA